jgi:hypothetical protein
MVSYLIKYQKQITYLIFFIITGLVLLSYNNLKIQKKKNTLKSINYFKNIEAMKDIPELFTDLSENDDIDDDQMDNINETIYKISQLPLPTDKSINFYMNKQSGIGSTMSRDSDGGNHFDSMPGTILNQTGFSGTTNVFSPVFFMNKIYGENINDYYANYYLDEEEDNGREDEQYE